MFFIRFKMYLLLRICDILETFGNILSCRVSVLQKIISILSFLFRNDLKTRPEFATFLIVWTKNYSRETRFLLTGPWKIPIIVNFYRLVRFVQFIIVAHPVIYNFNFLNCSWGTVLTFYAHFARSQRVLTNFKSGQKTVILKMCYNIYTIVYMFIITCCGILAQGMSYVIMYIIYLNLNALYVYIV